MKFLSLLGYGIALMVFLLGSAATANGLNYNGFIFASPVISPPTITGISSDNGINNSDGITNDQTLTISGTSEANATIIVTRMGVGIIGTTVSNNTGFWSYDYTGTTLVAGSYAFTTSTTYGESDTSSSSNAFAVVIDTTAPVAPIVLGITTDAGLSPSDGITNDQTLVLVGSSEAYSKITVSMAGTGVIGTATANGSGKWSYDYSGTILPAGSYTFMATATDVAGNISSLSLGLVIKIDFTAPSSPIFTGVSNDTGSSSSDRITSDQTLVISGTAEANSIISIARSGAGVVGAATANGSGIWSYDYTATTLSDGSYTFSATAMDAAGNLSSASKDFNVTIDNLIPTVGISSIDANPTSSNPITIIIDFNESVTGFTVDDIVVNGAIKGDFNGGETSYVLEVIPSTDGVITVNIPGAVALDIAGNNNAVAPSFNITYVKAPNVAITSSTTSFTNSNPIPVAINFNEDVTGFDISDITVSGGTKGNFSGSGKSYNVDIAPSDNGIITVDVPANVAQNEAGNKNLAAPQLTRMYDIIAPAVIISSASATPQNTVPVVINVDFSESVTDFTINDLIVSGGTASNFAGGGKNYIVEIIPSNDGIIAVNAPANIAKDAAGNNNTAASQFSFIYDGTAPTVVITSTKVSPTNDNPIPVKMNFSESVTGFTVRDIEVKGGIISSFAGSGASYMMYVAPIVNDLITVDIASNMARDVAGNGNIAAPQFSIDYDGAAPTVGITSTTSSPANSSPLPIKINFSESVTDFILSDIKVNGGTKSNFSGSGANYTFDIIPIKDGILTIEVPTSVAYDGSGNGNMASSVLKIVYDATSPTVTISCLNQSPTTSSLIPIKVNFNEPVTGFVLDDVVVTGGTKNNFAGSGSSYSFDVIPENEGIITIGIDANVAHDAASNGNTSAAKFSIIYYPCIATSITKSPFNKVVCLGGSTNFAIAAVGTDLQYQWQINAGTGYADLINDKIYQGANTAILNLSEVSKDMDNLRFRCIVSGICSPSATSEDAVLAVNQLSVLVPEVITICEGESTTITSDGAVNYYWSHGPTTSTITVSPLSTTTYTVTAVNSNNCVSSKTLTVKVNPLPAVIFSLKGKDTVCTTSPVFKLPEGIPSGGTYSGNGVSGNIFNASDAGVGLHTITYSYINVKGCLRSASASVLVRECKDYNPATGLISLHPNPTDDRLNIAFDAVYNITVEISSQWGQKIFHKSKSTDVMDISLKSVGAGTYYVVIWKDNKLIRKAKIIKN